MTSEPGNKQFQYNISRRKGNQAMKYGQVIDITILIFFLINHAEMRQEG